MCGIVGVYSKKGNISVDKSVFFLKKSLKKMNFRGPDLSKNKVYDNFYAAGFVRLAIRDLSENGMQPMTSDCGNYVLSFNGEIYNTTNLLNRLKKFNIKFKSKTDTEIILYIFKYFGFEKSVKLLDGIFSIAFYNKKSSELFLARDRAGTKPLYIYNDGEHLIYSSHYNQVIKNDFVSKRKINNQGLSAYIKLGYVPSSLGFFDNTMLIPQGAYVKVLGNRYDCITYFDLKKNNDSYKTELKKTIQNSVNQQLVSDVPVGTFLSGGIDSSIVTLFANIKQKICAFTIGFNDEKLNESDIAEKFANDKKINFKKEVFDDINYDKLIEDNILAFSEPFSDFSSLPTLLLSDFAKKYVTVTLSGDGGDELFYGYPRNVKYGSQAKLLTSSKISKLYKIIISKIFNKPLKLSIREVLLNPIDALIESNYITNSKIIGKKIFPKINNKIYLNHLNIDSLKINSEKDFIEQIRYFEYYYHLQRILIKVDRASMYHSLETRVPLLSNNVIDMSLQFSFKDCVKLDKGKIPLREILKNEVDSNLFDLPKRGFGINISKLINDDNSNIIKKYLLLNIPELDEYLDTKYIEKIYKKHKNNEGDYQYTSWMLWSIFSLKAWYVNHILNY
jgi:asparagine synthase (glutamine-hydrolysing)